jgi:hypothetical protein
MAWDERRHDFAIPRDPGIPVRSKALNYAHPRLNSKFSSIFSIPTANERL